MPAAFSHVFSIISFLLGIILVTQLLRARKAPGSTVAWLLAMVLIPYIGVPLYIFLGSRKRRGKVEQKFYLYEPVPYLNTSADMLTVERVLLASGAPPKSSHNQLKILASGEEAYVELKRIILDAKVSIYVTTFILGRDSVGREMIELLAQKARGGVEVCLLIDGLGSLWAPRRALRKLRAAGGKVAFFSPIIRMPWHIPWVGSSNLRNHRKSVIVDSAEAILGGMNIAAEYLGPQSPRKRWVDLALLVKGPAVKNIESIFQSDWHYTVDEPPLLSSEFHSDPSGSVVSSATCATSATDSIENNRIVNSTLQIVASGPDVAGDLLYDSIVSAIFSAKKRIWIATPYFIPDETLSKSLELACRRGVDVRLIIPKRSNHLLADLSRGSYLKQLDQAGGRLFFYPRRLEKGEFNMIHPKMMHAKMMLFDETYCLVGSANMDMRSLLLNYEVGVFLYSQIAIQEMAQWYVALADQCSEHHMHRSRWTDILDGFGRVLGPML